MASRLPPALVLTAGLGTRLAPLTRGRAKPAVPVAGVPLILRILAWLAREGVRDVVLNLHHRPASITRLVGHGDRLGVRVRYSWEPVILGSAGGPRHAVPLLGPRFFIINGDTLTDLPLAALRDRHERMGASVTLAVTGHPSPDRYGGVRVDADGWVQGFTRRGGALSEHFIGVQLVDATAFADVPDGDVAATIGGLYDSLVAERPHAIGTHAGTRRFHDVGTPQDYLATSLAIADDEGLPTLPVGEDTVIHPTASLTRTLVWDRVDVGARCQLHECIITDGVRLPPGTELNDQIAVVADRRSTDRDQRRVGNAVVLPLARRLDGGRR